MKKRELKVKDEDVRGSMKKALGYIANRKYCGEECPFFELCPLAPYSLTSAGRECMMKQTNERLQRRFYRLFLTGERDDFLQELKEEIYQFAIAKEKSGDIKDLERYVRTLMDLYKLKFGEKHEIDGEVRVKVEIKEVDADEDSEEEGQ